MMPSNFFKTEETRRGDWLYKYLGNGIYALYYAKTSDRRILLDVDETIRIPFPFRLLQLIFCFNDATTKDLTVYHIPIRALDLAYPPRVYKSLTDTHTDIIVDYSGFSWNFEANDALKIYIDGTTNKKCFPIIKIQRVMP